MTNDTTERKTVPHVVLPEGTLIAEHGALLMVVYSQGSRNPKSTQMLMAFRETKQHDRGVIRCMMCSHDLKTVPDDGIWAAREIIAHVRLHDCRKRVQAKGERLMASVMAQG